MAERIARLAQDQGSGIRDQGLVTARQAEIPRQMHNRQGVYLLCKTPNLPSQDHTQVTGRSLPVIHSSDPSHRTGLKEGRQDLVQPLNLPHIYSPWVWGIPQVSWSRQSDTDQIYITLWDPQGHRPPLLSADQRRNRI